MLTRNLDRSDDRSRPKLEGWRPWKTTEPEPEPETDFEEVGITALRGHGSAVLVGDSRPAVVVEGIGVLVALVSSRRLSGSNYHQELYF